MLIYMTAMRFVDTNILVHSLDLEPAEPRKAAIAREILTDSDIVLSVQVLQEFYVQATNPRRPDALPHEFASRLIDKWLRFRIQEANIGLLGSALDIKERFHISYWDAAILAAAKAAGCREVLSEDLSNGQDFDGVVVVNPFASL